jgi:phage-related holin
MKDMYETISKIFSLEGAFLYECIADILMWVLVMFSVILCDLITGCRKNLAMGEKLRLSRALWAMMGKSVTYFSFIVMMVFVEHASKDTHHLEVLAILFVCFIEFCSIVSNILKMKGYDINLGAAIGVFAKKVFGLDKEDTNEILIKTKNKKEKK